MSKRKFSTGAVRDSTEGKLNLTDYNDPLVEQRFALYMKKNEVKYGIGNWKRGIPKLEYVKSLKRHLHYLELLIEHGLDLDPSCNDHASAIRFNIDGFMYEEEKEHDRKI